MKFDKILAEHNCNCIENSIADTASIYALKTMKNFIRIQDFSSYWEKGKRPNDTNNCEEICSYKGVSISICNENTKDEVISIYKELFPLAPGYKPYVSLIKFNDDAGVVKHTPNDRNNHHYDFYKCDDFEITKVDVLEINDLH